VQALYALRLETWPFLYRLLAVRPALPLVSWQIEYSCSVAVLGNCARFGAVSGDWGYREKDRRESVLLCCLVENKMEEGELQCGYSHITPPPVEKRA